MMALLLLLLPMALLLLLLSSLMAVIWLMTVMMMMTGVMTPVARVTTKCASVSLACCRGRKKILVLVGLWTELQSQTEFEIAL